MMRYSASGGGSLTSWGSAFDSAGTVWTTGLCQQDSDDDGQTNGQELGDPCCSWTRGSTPAANLVNPSFKASHPGIASSKAVLPNVVCGGAGTTTIAPTPAAQSATTVLATTKSTVTAAPAQCWPQGGPMCAAPVVVNGGCLEGSAIVPGGSCTPVCADGLMVSGDCAVRCPPNGGSSTCTDAAHQSIWSAVCGSGHSCSSLLPLGTQLYSSYGSFFCAPPTAVLLPCNSTGVLHPYVVKLHAVHIAASLGLIGSLAVLAVLFACSSRAMAAQVLAVGLLRPIIAQWNLANIFGVLAVLGGLVAVVVSAKSSTEVIHMAGIAASTALIATVLWSWLRGLHSFVAMSREAAWRIHMAFGVFALVFGTAHAVVARLQGYNISSKLSYQFGLAGLVLMWSGVALTPLHKLFPSLLTYERWKGLHFLSLAGHLLVVVHFINYAWVSAPNIIVLALYIAHKMYMHVTAWKARVVEAKVVKEPSGSHIFLTLQAKDFGFKPGQWGYLQVSSVSMVPHPFTLVPSPDAHCVSFYIKVGPRSSSFTSQLSLAAANSDLNTIRLQGPFGEPPNVNLLPTVFVLGGVGITPALSLVPLACQSIGRVPLYWSTRSEALYNKATPMLENFVDMSLSVISLSPDRRAGAGKEVNPTPNKRKDIATWLREVSAQFKSKGHRRGQIFVCGPASMASAVKVAMQTGAAREVSWHLHAEQFEFLPSLPSLSFPKRQQQLPLPSVSCERSLLEVEGGPSQVHPNKVGAADGK